MQGHARLSVIISFWANCLLGVSSCEMLMSLYRQNFKKPKS